MMHYFFKTSCLLFLAPALYALPVAANPNQATIAATYRTDATRPIAPGDTLRLISRQFMFTEGPAVDAQGNIFFTDQPNDNIWKWATDGSLSLFMHGTGRSNGLYIDKEGNILACADAKNEVWRIAPDKHKTVLYKAQKRKRLNGPNDLWPDASGGIYLTDPYYQRPYWKRKHTVLKGQYVYYLPAGKKHLVTIETTLKQPNGVVGTPNGKQLYIADIGAGKIYKYDIASDGVLQNKTLFAEQLCDGLTLDNQGNVYVAGLGVTILDKDGKKIGHIDVPEKWTSNVCFGGAARDQLFITASEAVYVVPMQVKGVE